MYNEEVMLKITVVFMEDNLIVMNILTAKNDCITKKKEETTSLIQRRVKLEYVKKKNVNFETEHNLKMKNINF